MVKQFYFWGTHRAFISSVKTHFLPNVREWPPFAAYSQFLSFLPVLITIFRLKCELYCTLKAMQISEFQRWLKYATIQPFFHTLSAMIHCLPIIWYLLAHWRRPFIKIKTSKILRKNKRQIGLHSFQHSCIHCLTSSP